MGATFPAGYRAFLYALGCGDIGGQEFYMKEATKRGPGFGITSLASMGLLILSIWGVAAAFIEATAS